MILLSRMMVAGALGGSLMAVILGIPGPVADRRAAWSISGILVPALAILITRKNSSEEIGVVIPARLLPPILIALASILFVGTSLLTDNLLIVGLAVVASLCAAGLLYWSAKIKL